MEFNSFQYLCFFPIVVCIYFALPHRFRWVLLLGASYYFYACWKTEYLVLIILSTVVAYCTGLAMGRSKTPSHRKMFLILSLIMNLGILFGFKYFNFFNDSIRITLSHFNLFYNMPSLKVLLPLGISFYIFQTLSYSIDVYRGERKSEKHLGIFALYVSFFPQLVAGPIERSTRLLPQFFENRGFNYQNASNGLKIMLWGFFKKIVIADQLAMYVNEVFNNVGSYKGVSLILATYFFAFQIYCDFSGYSDIAIGSARVMGFRLMKNFNRPYFATSVSDFWKRWHISLSSWFKDYLYIPLGGSRVKKEQHYFNLLTVFLLSGLWHGANWTFIIWGAIHGLFVIMSALTTKIRKRIQQIFIKLGITDIYKLCGIVITFHLVLFAWIFFRANTVQDAFEIVSRIWFGLSPASGDWFIRGISMYDLVLNGILILILLSIEMFQARYQIIKVLSQTPIWVRWPVYYAGVMSILLFGQLSSQQQFIYFQF